MTTTTRSTTTAPPEGAATTAPPVATATAAYAAPTTPVRDPAHAARPTVATYGLSKWFGTKVAVSDVTCSFGPGITGLLGPNGAGKTTLLRMITGLLRPSEGSVSVFGSDPRKNASVYRRIGFAPEDDAVYGHLSTRELVRYAAQLSRCDASDRAVNDAIARVNMQAAADRPIAQYSKGMRQRAKVAAALVNNPDFLVLDEPLNGADPAQRAVLIGLFHDLAAEGRTIIVSSHVLAEVERMTDRVITILDGKVAAAGNIRAIRAAMSHIPHRVRIDADNPRAIATALLDVPAVIGVHLLDGSIEVETSSLAALGTALPRISIERSVRVTRFEPVDVSLESVFRHLLSIRR